jgi:23S rRNA (uracil1939-C5)-methyltransferase
VSGASLCRHFGTCGGCTYQDMPDEAYRAFKRGAVVYALASHGLGEASIAEIVEVPPHSRRRAAFKCAKADGKTLFGFHAAQSHAIVDMRECRILTPTLFGLVAGLRDMMAALLAEGEKAELAVSESAGGADVAIRWSRKLNSRIVSDIARFATELKLARVTANGETMVELATPSATFGRAQVALPVDAFLQPTRLGEAVLQEKVLAGVSGAKSVADLFAGCGTFALVLAEKMRVHAVETDGAALDALEAAARAAQGLKPVTVERRDLFKLPLAGAELARFDAVVLDPPRVGANAQAKELAKSKIRRIVYVSCNPASFARDASILVREGFRMGTVTPVDQFLWSSHIELVASFTRE